MEFNKFCFRIMLFFKIKLQLFFFLQEMESNEILKGREVVKNVDNEKLLDL